MSLNISTPNYSRTLSEIETLVRKGPKYVFDALTLVDSIEDQSFKDKAHARITELSLQRFKEQSQPVKPKKPPLRRYVTTNASPQCNDPSACSGKCQNEGKTSDPVAPAPAKPAKGEIVETSLRALDSFLSKPPLGSIISYQAVVIDQPGRRTVVIPTLDPTTLKGLAAIVTDDSRGPPMSATREKAGII